MLARPEKRECIIVPILWGFSKINFTHLGSLQCRSRHLLRCRSKRQLKFTLVYFGTLPLPPTLATAGVNEGTEVPSCTLACSSTLTGAKF